jgi:hypothetical protein
MGPLKIDPPLLNSASPWATTLEDIQALYECPFTGAVLVSRIFLTEVRVVTCVEWKRVKKTEMEHVRD